MVDYVADDREGLDLQVLGQGGGLGQGGLSQDDFGDATVPLNHAADGSPRRGGEDSPRGPTRFGRGWIPVERDLGIPGEEPGNSARCGASEKSGKREGGGEGHRILPSSSSENLSDAASGPGVRRDDDGFVSHHGWDAVRKVRFLDRLSEKGDVRAAAAFVGMSRQSAYVLRRRDGVFASGWAAAMVLARRHAEEVLATRALDGIEEAVWFRGELVGTRRKFDARLLLAHLERLDRQASETASDLAERFDELLALVAGAVPDPLLICHPDAPGDPDPVLPPPRAVFADAAAHDACASEIEVFENAMEQGCASPEDEPAPDYAQWRTQFCAMWDDWRDDAFACADGVLGEGAARQGRGVTLGAGVDGRRLRSTVSLSGCHVPLQGRTLDSLLDRVNCVNLRVNGAASDYRPKATFRLRGGRAGNAFGLSLLSL